jgi:hypothetical protein
MRWTPGPPRELLWGVLIGWLFLMPVAGAGDPLGARWSTSGSTIRT